MPPIFCPILKSDSLKSKPVPFSFFGEDLVVYRGESGRPHVMQRSCPHRGFDLQYASARGEDLQCPYHSWTFQPDGTGHSPGTPRITCKHDRRDAADYQGAIWVRESGEGPFEESEAYQALQVPDARWCGLAQVDFEGPMEVVIDNFNEIEHTGSVHGSFGYPPDRMNEVDINWERLAERRFQINAFGPQKPIRWYIRKVLRLENSDFYEGEWITTLHPWISHYTNRWYRTKDRQGAREFTLKLKVFYQPLSEKRTRLFAFIYCAGLRFHSVLRHVLMRVVRRELGYDQDVVAKLYDPMKPLSGRRLGRFDAVLQEMRKDHPVPDHPVPIA